MVKNTFIRYASTEQNKAVKRNAYRLQPEFTVSQKIFEQKPTRRACGLPAA